MTSAVRRAPLDRDTALPRLVTVADAASVVLAVVTLSTVLTGGFRDENDGAEYGPGDLQELDAGTSHSFIAVEGPDCLCLGIVLNGIEVAGVKIWGAQRSEPQTSGSAPARNASINGSTAGGRTT